MTTTTINTAAAKTTLAEHVKEASVGMNQSVVIDAKTFVKDLAALEVKEEFDYYTRENRGHFRFFTEDGKKLCVSISEAGLASAPAKIKLSEEPSEILMWSLKNLTLRSGVSNTTGNDYLSFGVTGEGTLVTGKINLKAFIKAYAG